MITLTLLTIVAVLGLIVLFTVIGGFGAAFLVIFGDLIVAVLVIWLIVKLIQKLRGK